MMSTYNSCAKAVKLKYYPYGQEIGAVTANDRVKFGTYTRDSGSILDYAMNRYYQSTWGRFTSPDPYLGSASPEAPSSWNRYSYVGGDPVNATDSTGLIDESCANPNTFRYYGAYLATCQAAAGGGSGAPGEFRDTHDSMMWDVLMALQRFSSILLGQQPSPSTTPGDTPVVTSTIKYNLPDDPLNDDAAAILGQVGRSTGALTTPQFWAAWTAAAALPGASIGAFTGITGVSSGTLTTIAGGGVGIGIDGLGVGELILVSRWGQAGLTAGDWVMVGGTSFWNYLGSGKYQPGLGNQFAPFSSGQNYLIPRSSLVFPGSAEHGLGWIKGMLGQRLYIP